MSQWIEQLELSREGYYEESIEEVTGQSDLCGIYTLACWIGR